jgi:hypothetical protein
METTAARAGSSGRTSNRGPRAGAFALSAGCRAAMVLAACLCMSCTSLLPMTDNLKSSLSDEDVKRIMAITQLSEAEVRNPTIHEVHEVRLSCWQMFEQCYPSMPFYLKMLGSLPLGCTTIYQQPWNEKVAIIYSCWITDPITMAHEREHAKGEMHAYW